MDAKTNGWIYDEKQGIYSVSKYLPTKNLAIYKGEKE